jgi:hypothetical protein
MAWNDLTETKQLALLVRRGAGENLNQMAAEVGMKAETLRRRIDELKAREDFKIQAQSGIVPLPSVSTRVYNDFFVLQSDNVAIASDFEFPNADIAMIEALILMCIRYKIKDLILAGDLTSGDQAGLSTWLRTVAEDSELSYGSSINMVNNLLRILLHVVERIYVISSNHDERVAKANGGQVHFGMLIEKFGGRVQFSEYRYMYLRTSRSIAKICHPTNYSENGTVLAAQMYVPEAGPDPNHPENCDIIIAHVHNSQVGSTKDDLREAHSLGCMRNPYTTQYKSMTSNKFSQWNQGFMVVLNGYYYNLARKRTDWNMWLGEYAAKARITKNVYG